MYASETDRNGVFIKTVALDEESLKRAGMLADIEDRHIVKLRGFEKSEDGKSLRLYFERLTTLEEHIEKNGVTAEDVARLGTDICAALTALQKKGIVHRDVKPSNILYREEDGCFVLGDLGTAVPETEQNDTAGTLNYMAPEVFFRRGASHGSDIYSLGLVMYKLLNGGRLPLTPDAGEKMSTGQARAALEARLRGETLPMPRYAPEGLGRIVLRSCAFDEEERYHDAEEMACELEKLREKGEM